MWAKIEGFLLNLRGNICSNANNSLKNQDSVLKFDMQVNNNIMQQNIEKNKILIQYQTGQDRCFMCRYGQVNLINIAGDLIYLSSPG